MPELPEVEITRRGLLPLLNHQVNDVIIRNAAMRWPIPTDLPAILKHQTLVQLSRRAKYILATFQNSLGERGTLLLHLGMSGRISLLDRNYPAEKHDHFDILFEGEQVLRLRDPRRFGAVLWAGANPEAHALLKVLGPEPLSELFDADYLFAETRTRSAAIKSTIMDAHLVVGVGNIYASESLYRARIHPLVPANKLTIMQCRQLVESIKQTLTEALEAGGSSLRDFFGVDGNPGYFQQDYFVYARTRLPCKVCTAAIEVIRLGQRSTFYCPVCQQQLN